MIKFKDQKNELYIELSVKYEKTFSSSPKVLEKTLSEIDQWQNVTARKLLVDSPFSSAGTILSEWESLIEWNLDPKDYVEAVSEYHSFCVENGQPFEEGFWYEKFGVDEVVDSAASTARKDEALLEKGQAISFRLLLNEWRKKIDKVEAQWQLEYLDKLRSELINYLEEWLDLLESLSTSLHSLGLDPGIWLDMSCGDLSPGDIALLQRWARYLSEDSGAKAIAEILGKMRQIEQSEKVEKIVQSRSVQIPCIDVNSRQEIKGIKLAREIEHALPSELALLSDPDTSILFDLKYLEERLLCFEMQGEMYRDETEEYIEEITVSEDDKKGPMILCIDTSGSMSGTPESIAKAMALHLATLAQSQNRQCYLINFSTSITTYEFSAEDGLEKLIQFLQQSFHGGTDVAPALMSAIDRMESEEFRKADLLIISDFIMASLPEELLKRLDLQRASGNQFNSLVIGGCFMTHRLKTHFDNEWVFNPASGLLTELINFKHDLALSA